MSVESRTLPVSALARVEISNDCFWLRARLNVVSIVPAGLELPKRMELGPLANVKRSVL
jgi:hypothetical protein